MTKKIAEIKTMCGNDTFLKFAKRVNSKRQLKTYLKT